MVGRFKVAESVECGRKRCLYIFIMNSQHLPVGGDRGNGLKINYDSSVVTAQLRSVIDIYLPLTSKIRRCKQFSYIAVEQNNIMASSLTPRTFLILES
jgi:hypothetical protein